MSFHKTIVLGRLGADPNLRYTATGAPVANFSVAVDEFSGSGEARRQFTQWYRVVAWNGQAENVQKYLTKGREVLIEGRMRTRNYDDKDGITRFATELVADRIQFVGTNPNKEPTDAGEFVEEDEVLSEEPTAQPELITA